MNEASTLWQRLSYGLGPNGPTTLVTPIKRAAAAASIGLVFAAMIALIWPAGFAHLSLVPPDVAPLHLLLAVGTLLLPLVTYALAERIPPPEWRRPFVIVASFIVALVLTTAFDAGTLAEAFTLLTIPIVAGAAAWFIPRTHPLVIAVALGWILSLVLGVWQGYFVVGIDKRPAKVMQDAAQIWAQGIGPYYRLLVVFFISACAGTSVFLALVLPRLGWSWCADDKLMRQEAAHGELFRPEWTGEDRMDEAAPKPKRGRLFIALMAIVVIYGGYLTFLVLGLFSWPLWPAPLGSMLEATFINPLMTVNTYGKMLLMICFALIAAYNRRLRHHACWMLAFGHVVSIVMLVLFGFVVPLLPHELPALAPWLQSVLHWALPDLAKVLRAAPATLPYAEMFPIAIAIDAVFAVIALYGAFRPGKPEQGEEEVDFDEKIPDVASPPAKWAKASLYVVALVSLWVVVILLWIRFGGAPSTVRNPEVYRGLDIQLCNALTKYSVLAVLAWRIAKRPRLRERFQAVAVLVYGVTAFTSTAFALVVSLSPVFGGLTVRLPSLDPKATGIAVDGEFARMAMVSFGVLGMLLVVESLYYRTEQMVASIAPNTARGVAALHSALFGANAIATMQAVQRFEAYIAGVRGHLRVLLTAPYFVLQSVAPLVGARPALSLMSHSERLYFLRLYVLRPPSERRRSWSPELADKLAFLGDGAGALISFAHYSTRNGAEELGYIPPDARERLQDNDTPAPPGRAVAAKLPLGPHLPGNYFPSQHQPERLIAPRVVTPVKDEAIPDEVDYLVIGSGAGASVVAWRLTQLHKGKVVMMVERGPRLSPLQDFNHDEMTMIRRLYRDGGLQQTRRFDMVVLQGDCVGGSTVIANATLFDPPATVLAEWEATHGISQSRVQAACTQVGKDIDLQTVPDSALNVNVTKRFADGVAAYNAANLGKIGRCETAKAAYTNHRGDGLCNLGNKYMRKRSALETYVAWAEGSGAIVVSETEVVKFSGSKNGDCATANSVLVRTRAGELKRVKIRTGGAVVVAAGAIASSRLLLDSGVTGERVGQKLSCNFGLPICLDFGDENRVAKNVMDAFDGAQITQGAASACGRIMYETYFNPPGALALTLPLHLHTHRATMLEYSNLMNIGALVGSNTGGVVEREKSFLQPRGFKWKFDGDDKDRISRALLTLADLGFHAGARRAHLPLRPGLVLDLTRDRDAFRKALEGYELTMHDVRMCTAHPQGGNCMSGDKRYSVVDTEFRVRGWSNVYVADASLFPSSIAVNPQLTVQALGWMAADHIG